MPGVGPPPQGAGATRQAVQNGEIDKTYWAVAEGGPDADEGVIELPLGRLDETRGWWMKHDPDGQPAVTSWRVWGERADTQTGKKTSWLALEPLTGRTHQLRVHCAAMGWPILGDTIYGTAPRFGGPGLQLHARAIAVPLYKNRDPVHVTAPVPQHMRERLAACGWSGVEVRTATASLRGRSRSERARNDDQ